ENVAGRRFLRSLEFTQQREYSGQNGPPKEEAEATLNSSQVDADSLSLFVTRVQPTLMNACAGCHATGRGGSFKIARRYEHGLVSRKTTYQNLASVLAQLNQDHYQQSPFLIKAVTVHGEMAQPALKGRDVPAYKTLEEWAKMTVENKQPL